MKKIPTLFKRVFTEDHQKTITREVTPGCECVLRGECTATVKWDGACCAIINGEIYKRYDAKKGKDGKQKKPPEGAIPCQPEPDPITGHWPHWVKCENGKPEDQHFLQAFKAYEDNGLLFIADGTYEAIGMHWQSNPYEMTSDFLIPHGVMKVANELLQDKDGNITFDSIKECLEKHHFCMTPGTIEGIVFWKDGEPVCKIKRSDFGFPWPVKSK